MLSKTLTGVTVPDYDESITKMLNAKGFEGGGRMVIAIENHEGQVYRIIRPEGMGGYFNCVYALLDMGLIDLIGPNKPASREGYDNRFTFNRPE
ncbi:hypothetical protein [Craterilacuibacter sp. RT1T]|uniref:hypothetical protein n=1 Tax=Craterilacuibacter sp. RT1T TaxID=2942211 RepID=UPI0020BD8B2D|nr:hypothetical protein [Craterilacuibacter sp. RT1T]MCL6262149.1 hypothetical protein [Craterilacuibacter sp. RT1T]